MYELSGGSLTATQETVGATGYGLFLHEDGTNSVNDLEISQTRRGGYYQLGGAGGSPTLTVQHDEFIEDGGVFRQIEGSHEVKNQLVVNPGGTYQWVSGDLRGKQLFVSGLFQMSKQMAQKGHLFDRVSGQGTFKIMAGGRLWLDLDVATIIDGTATIEVSQGATLRLSGSGNLTTAHFPRILNYGTTELTDSGGVAGDGTIENYGMLNKSSTTGGTASLPGYVGSGTVNVRSGTLTLGAAYFSDDTHKTGPGTLNIPGNSSGARLYVDGGIVNIGGADGLSITAASRTSVNFGPTTRGHGLGDLTLQSGSSATLAAGPGPSIGIGIRRLDMVGSARFDLGDGVLGVTRTVNGQPVDGTYWGPGARALNDLVKSGYAGGQWNGSGIYTSVAGWNMVGVGLLSQQLYARYVPPGDRDLNGWVDLLDAPPTGPGLEDALWTEGDMNYDGRVDQTDLDIIVNHLGSTLNNLHIGWGPLPATVPAGKSVTIERPLEGWGTGTNLDNGTTVGNQGTITLADGGRIIGAGGTLRNDGLFDVQGDGPVIDNPAGGLGATFVNTGILRKSGGTGISSFPAGVQLLNSGGTLDVQVGTLRVDGDLTVSASSSLTKIGDGTLEVGGTLAVGPAGN